jgi:eukaryotic-like serine/threonine-protein kinase
MQPGYLLNHRYRIDRELSVGGFGQTFIATDTNLPSQPQVVVKLLKPQSNDPKTLPIAQRLFRQEAEILEKLGKDNDRVPALYAYFESNGDFYLVQEFIVGATLAEELQGRRFSESDVLTMLTEILTALATVHDRNIIHRDLKPDNIIRRERDRKLVLIDFGSVKQVRAASATTPISFLNQTICIGTPGYMPTEQGMGYPKPASDIYAVGAIAIECLTGVYPHKLFDEHTDRLEWHHLCRVKPEVANVLDRMVEQDYHKRYADATEALSAIASLIAPPAVTTTPPVQPIPTTLPPSIETTLPPQRKDRRNFLKWLGYGGVGVVSVLALSQIAKNRSSKIQFTSVKLNNKGETIDKPTGSAEVFTENLGRGAELTMVKIPAGKFLMGSPQTESERKNDESPQHQVNVPEFYLGQTPITQAQWVAIMNTNPAKFQGNDKLPVERVSWLDAVDFCEKLSQKTGRIYRLPSEAEWEYAARAGTSDAFAFGKTITPEVVNYDGNNPYGGAVKGKDRQKTTPVDTFPPNLFGLNDMHGNVWEWCLDEWRDSYNGAPTDGSVRGNVSIKDRNKQRLLRGGSGLNAASNCRSAYRNYGAASIRYINIGLRVVSVISKTS